MTTMTGTGGRAEATDTGPSAAEVDATEVGISSLETVITMVKATVSSSTRALVAHMSAEVVCTATEAVIISTRGRELMVRIEEMGTAGDTTD